MRVLVLNNEFPPLGGGVATINEELFKQFAKVPDLEIDLVTSARGKVKVEDQFAKRIHIIKVPVNNRNIHHATNRELITYALRALCESRKLHEQKPYDLSFALSGVPAGWVSLRLNRATGLPYLIMVGGADIPGFEKRYRMLYPFLTPVIRSVWHHAETIVAKCQAEVDLIRAVDASVRTSIIPNGVDASVFRRDQKPSLDGPLRIVCVGRLIERKGQRHVMEAVKRLTREGIDASLDLVGTGDAQSAYEQLARDLGITDRVQFFGYVPRERIAEHFTKAHVFVLSSFYEGMSVATLEAMASGLPLVVTTNGTAELVTESDNGFRFDYGDVDKLTSHLRHLAQNRSLIHSMGEASRQRARNFTWDVVSDQYLRIFRQIVTVSNQVKPTHHGEH